MAAATGGTLSPLLPCVACSDVCSTLSQGSCPVNDALVIEVSVLLADGRGSIIVVPEPVSANRVPRSQREVLRGSFDLVSVAIDPHGALGDFSLDSDRGEFVATVPRATFVRPCRDGVNLVGACFQERAGRPGVRAGLVVPRVPAPNAVHISIMPYAKV